VAEVGFGFTVNKHGSKKQDPFAAFRKWGAQGGKVKSKAKTLAARENGKLGGRPKKKG
jgi:hypothetical protein